MNAPRSFQNALCLGCGCLCDDINVLEEEDRLRAGDRACALGAEWFAALRNATDPSCTIDRQPASWTDALRRAAAVLSDARAPLVCGLSGVATDAQRLAVGIADRLGGYCDWTSTPADTAPTLAAQQLGEVTATLGEIAQRADLVIFWRCDPMNSHPRHLERYANRPLGPFANDRTKRSIVFVGPADSATAGLADWTLTPNASSDLDALQALRQLLQDAPLPPPTQARLGEDLDSWRRLAGLIGETKHTAILYDSTLTRQGPEALEQMTLLAQQSQQGRRLVTAPLGTANNAAGAQAVMTWQTGYPMAVSLARGYPEYGPDEYTTEALLTSGEADAALVVSARGVSRLGRGAREALRGLPTVLLADTPAEDLQAGVEFSVAPLGSKPGGSVYRSDGVTLPMQIDFFPQAISHAGVLEGLLEQLA